MIRPHFPVTHFSRRAAIATEEGRGPLAVWPGLSKGRRGGMKKRYPQEPRPELRTSVVQEICLALTRAIPPHWNAVALTLTPLSELQGGLSHEIWSPEGHEDAVLVPMEIDRRDRKVGTELAGVRRRLPEGGLFRDAR